jgi:N6-L-threonylcarbamoyladenine synthase
VSQSILIIESTCDETACAIVREDLQVAASIVASQEALHRKFHGVVPEIAARAHVERILPVIDETLRRASMSLGDLSAIAVANTPGLAGSLVVGLTAAKSLCLAADKPLIAINHLHAHIYACRMAWGESVFPCVGLVVSGGHTHLYHCASALDFKYLGGTIDDAAGEAFDKVAAMLGLEFPGGPAISRVAEQGNPRAFDFPRALVKDRSRLDFSFSGLKTAVRYAIAGQGKQDWSKIKLAPQTVADVAASFQQAVVDCLVAKSILALEITGRSTLCVGGGVAANRLFRSELTNQLTQRFMRLFIAPIEWCTDNAVMGAIAFERFWAGDFDSLEVDVLPGLVRR